MYCTQYLRQVHKVLYRSKPERRYAQYIKYAAKGYAKYRTAPQQPGPQKAKPRSPEGRLLGLRERPRSRRRGWHGAPRSGSDFFLRSPSLPRSPFGPVLVRLSDGCVGGTIKGPSTSDTIKINYRDRIVACGIGTSCLLGRTGHGKVGFAKESAYSGVPRLLLFSLSPDGMI